MNMKDMEVKTNNATLNYPSTLTLGSKLADNEFTAYLFRRHEINEFDFESD